MPKFIAIMSGKGGVGKSTLSSYISLLFSETKKTLILDFDICGPSINHIFNTTEKVKKAKQGLQPICINNNLYVLSMSSLIKPNDSVIWRGPKKLQILNLFYESTNDFEVVIIDLPPGLSEEHVFLLDKDVSVIFVTSPQNLSLSDTVIAIDFCIENNIKIIGLIENLSGYQCEKCCENTNIFGKNGGLQLAEEYEIDFLGSVPISDKIGKCIEDGNFMHKYNKLDEFREIEKVLKDKFVKMHSNH
ncbi:Nucleotide-binding protein 2 [Gurleya vavrai]